MTGKENHFDIRGMYIELYLPGESPAQCLVPVLSHGDRIVTVESGSGDLHGCDALITENRSVSLGIKTADCAAICFGDGKKIGIAHIGWRGLCAGLVEKMLPNFNANELAIYVSPFLHSFEIQRDFCYDEVSKKFGSRFFTEGDKLVFNFKEALSSLLPSQTIFDNRNTKSDRSFPSNPHYRTAERFITTVRFS